MEVLLKALSILGFGKRKEFFKSLLIEGRMRFGQTCQETSMRCDNCLPKSANGKYWFIRSPPANENYSICKKNKSTWVHVDGAFGLWAGASPTKSYLTKGVELRTVGLRMHINAEVPL